MNSRGKIAGSENAARTTARGMYPPKNGAAATRALRARDVFRSFANAIAKRCPGEKHNCGNLPVSRRGTRFFAVRRQSQKRRIVSAAGKRRKRPFFFFFTCRFDRRARVIFLRHEYKIYSAHTRRPRLPPPAATYTGLVKRGITRAPPPTTNKKKQRCRWVVTGARGSPRQREKER